MHRQPPRLNEAVLGEEHPSTLTSISQLADIEVLICSRAYVSCSLPCLELQQFATLASHTRKGLGRMLVDTSLQWAAEHNEEIDAKGWKGMVLVHRQVSVGKVCAKMGFVTDVKLGRCGEEDIEHFVMWRRLKLR